MRARGQPGDAAHLIQLQGLRVLGVHGVLAEERERAQPFEVDADVWCASGLAGVSDRLEDAVDYGALVSAAAAVLEGPASHQLLESLADAVATALLAVDPKVTQVRVVVRKLRPPVPEDLMTAGVEVLRPAAGPGSGAAVRAFLGLGSNQGERLDHLRDAVVDLGRGGDVVDVSPVYLTAAVGGPLGQDDYLNAVVELSTADSPRRLLERAREAEARAHRVRTERFGPRTLDVDVLWIAGTCIVEPDLVVPHPRLWQRRFVLAPLADLAPEMVSAEALELAGGEVRRVGTMEEVTL